MVVINTICISWGNVFGPEYVNRLSRGIRRKTRSDVRFFCLTDSRDGLDRDIEALDLGEEPFHEEMQETLKKAPRRGPMRKVSMFRPDLIPDLVGPLLALDVDIVVTGDLADLVTYAPGKVSMRRVWASPSRMVGVGHGSVLKFIPSKHSYLYEKMARDPQREILRANGSEQSYTSYAALEAGDFEPFPDSWIASFKYDCRPPRPLNLALEPKLPEEARVVCFHGRPKMHEAVEGYRSDPLHFTRSAGWLRDAWR